MSEDICGFPQKPGVEQNLYFKWQGAQKEIATLRAKVEEQAKEIAKLKLEWTGMKSEVHVCHIRLAAARQENQALLSETWKEHKPCTNEQHDPLNGKISGYCVRCGTVWPCQYSPEAAAQQENRARFVAGKMEVLEWVRRLILTGVIDVIDARIAEESNK